MKKLTSARLLSSLVFSLAMGSVNAQELMVSAAAGGQQFLRFSLVHRLLVGTGQHIPGRTFGDLLHQGVRGRKVQQHFAAGVFGFKQRCQFFERIGQAGSRADH